MKNQIKKIEEFKQNETPIYAIGGKGSISDYNFCQETFYKKDGEYFILGVGGAGSPYRTGNGSTAIGAQKVIPCSKEYFYGRIKADKEGWTWDGEGYFRYTDSGDIEHLNIKTGEI